MRTASIIWTLLFVFSTANAAYYAQDYDPDYVPYNFEDAADADFGNCNSVLEQFDDVYNELDRQLEVWKRDNSQASRSSFVSGWEVAPRIDGERIQRFSQLKSSVEESIRICLVEFREWEEEQEELEEEEERKEAAQRYEEQKQGEMQQALSECDFDFFATMSESEKMATYDERKACENSSQPKSVVTPAPVVTPPTTINPTVSTPPVRVYEPDIEPSSTETTTGDFAEVEETTIVSTTTVESERIELTQEELDNLLREEVAKAIEEKEIPPQPEPKPSIFKRVASFLFGWLW